MKKIGWKRVLPYAGVPVLLLVLILVQGGRVEGISLLLKAVLTVFGYVAALSDLREKRVPNMLVASMLAIWVLIMVPQLFFRTEYALHLLLDSGAGFLIGGILFLVVYFISRKGLGGGDVKLMAVSGLYLGFDGVLPSMLYGSLLAAVTGIVLILSKRIGRKDTIPLVPFLYIGMVLTMLIQ